MAGTRPKAVAHIKNKLGLEDKPDLDFMEEVGTDVAKLNGVDDVTEGVETGIAVFQGGVRWCKRWILASNLWVKRCSLW